jgi:hypothetical protein
MNGFQLHLVYKNKLNVVKQFSFGLYQSNITSNLQQLYQLSEKQLIVQSTVHNISYRSPTTFIADILIWSLFI